MRHQEHILQKMDEIQNDSNMEDILLIALLLQN